MIFTGRGLFVLKDFKYTSSLINCNDIAITGYSGKDEKVMVPEKIHGRQVTEIKSWTFAGKQTIKEIIIPNGVFSIGSFTFEKCHKLEKITFPESLRVIFVDVFKDCPSLKTICFQGTEEQWNEILIHSRDRLSNVKIKFNESSKLSQFLNDCKDAEELRKE